MLDTFPATTSFQSQNLHLPQFIEVFCRIAIVVHRNRVKNGGKLREAIETTKLDFCLQSLFSYMDIQPNKENRDAQSVQGGLPAVVSDETGL